MWTNVYETFTSNDSQNAWAFLASTNAWNRILPGAADGVTNVFLLISTAMANNRQVYIVLDANNEITQAYM
jgi:hypothetical protein